MHSASSTTNHNSTNEIRNLIAQCQQHLQAVEQKNQECQELEVRLNDELSKMESGPQVTECQELIKAMQHKRATIQSLLRYLR